MLFAASLTEQVTNVIPIGKFEPDEGRQVGLPTAEQLSLTVGAMKLTGRPELLMAVTITLAGQAIVGNCISFTVTVKLHELRLLAASLAVQVTVVTPFTKVEPEAGLQVGTPTPEQLSLTVGAT